MQHIVILGAGYAGMMTALRLSHTTRHNETVTVTLINASENFVERIRLYEMAARKQPTAHPIRYLLRGTGVRFLQGWVVEIRPNERHIEISTAQGLETLHYDKLVYALGSSVARSGIPGAAEFAYMMDTDSAQLLMARVPAVARRSGKVIVIGGGLTGIEVAAELAETYPDLCIAMVTRSAFGDALSDGGRAYLHQTFETLGIDLYENNPVTAIEQDHVKLADGSALPYDLCIWAAGFRAAPLAKQAGFAVNTAGQIIVDPCLRSISHPDVFATGDTASFEADAPLKLRMSCQIAMPMGAHVADNLSAYVYHQAPEPFKFGYTLQCIALGKKRGLTQVVKPDDSMTTRIYTGRTGAFIKSVIVKWAFWGLKLERIIPRGYIWLKSINLNRSHAYNKALRDH